jgi:hypothetical protein
LTHTAESIARHSKTFYKCTATFRTHMCKKCLWIKLNGFRPIETLVDITPNTLYKCTATFRTRCTCFLMALRPNAGYGLLFHEVARLHRTIPLDEWSPRRRDLYQATHNNYKRQTLMPKAGFELSISGSERQQIYAIDPPRPLGSAQICIVIIIPPMVQQPLLGQGLIHSEASRSHSDTPHSIRLFWMNDPPNAKTSTWQHTSLTRDKHSSPGDIEPAILASKRPQTHVSDRAVWW